MPGPGDLFEAAQELLDAAAEALDTIPDLIDGTYLGAPTRQFVSPGLPVADCCEMLTAWVDPLGEGARTPRSLAATVRINTPTINVMILRCVPTGQVIGKKYHPPVADALTASSRQILADGWAIWNHLFNLVNASPESLLFAKCEDLLWTRAPSVTPSGGCGGWRFGLTLGLDGYTEDLGST